MGKISPKEFADRREVARMKGITEGSTWSHYKGGIYVIDGFGVETHHGGFLVRYHRVGGPGFKATAEVGMDFFCPPEEWDQIVDHQLGTKRFTRLRA